MKRQTDKLRHLGIVRAVTEAISLNRDDYSVFLSGPGLSYFDAVVSNDQYDFLNKDAVIDSRVMRVRQLYSSGRISHMLSISKDAAVI